MMFPSCVGVWLRRLQFGCVECVLFVVVFAAAAVAAAVVPQNSSDLTRRRILSND